jgi:hypothetical protein
MYIVDIATDLCQKSIERRSLRHFAQENKNRLREHRPQAPQNRALY